MTKKSDQGAERLDGVRIAVALRMGRAAVGWSQEEFAKKMGVSKATIARIETVESAASSTVLMKALHLLRDAGVEVDLMKGDDVFVHVNAIALNEAAARLEDEQLRRPDRKKGKDKADKA